MVILPRFVGRHDRAPKPRPFVVTPSGVTSICSYEHTTKRVYRIRANSSISLT